MRKPCSSWCGVLTQMSRKVFLLSFCKLCSMAIISDALFSQSRHILKQHISLEKPEGMYWDEWSVAWPLAWRKNPQAWLRLFMVPYDNKRYMTRVNKLWNRWRMNIPARNIGWGTIDECVCAPWKVNHWLISFTGTQVQYRTVWSLGICQDGSL